MSSPSHLRPVPASWDVGELLEPSPGVDRTVRELLLSEVRRMGEVPLLPPVAREVMAMLQDPRMGMAQVATLVKKDPAMAAHLLRVANSAAYAGPSPVTSIQMGLVRLGAEGVKRFLLSTSAARVLVVHQRPELTTRLRTRSVAVSNAAARVAAHYGTDIDAAFVAGLLHDMGWAVGYGAVHKVLPNLPASWRTDPGQVDLAVEALHEELGAVLATSWKLPPNAVDAIRSHHDPSQGGGLMAYVVHVASRICDSLGIGPCDADTGDLLLDPAVVRLKVDNAALIRIVAGVKRDLGVG